MKPLLFTVILLIFIFGCSSTKQEDKIPAGELDIKSMLQSAPTGAKFINDSSFIWGAGLVKSASDQKYHMFYSRWPHKFGWSAWVTHSEIAHAVSDSPFGPFKFVDVALPARGAEFWDGMVTHNPNVHYFNGKYYLYYMGNRGDGIPSNSGESLNWTHRNNQRIGVAVADDPNGPWKRFDEPVIDVTKDSTAHDALMTSNPSVTQMADGRYLAVYKAVGKKKPMPFGGPVVHLTAIADSPTGPFVKQNKPIFTSEGVMFPAEDPYVWYQDNCLYTIIKDQQGYFANAGRSLVLFYSIDGTDWKLANHPLVSTLVLKWRDGTEQELEALERPQLYMENGKPVALLCAGKEPFGNSFNVQIPLISK
ncbi:family 43 glycosylhydrolase [Maribellus comscasis]|uniref:Family 43 glycosylhydrolase n=1 Tax=Maribellus comscasis TaxID=2681766 RepID=A0A6I6K4G5_9BACT|nr:glycoside hydrolase family protein [Maribellus comscasis]QGY47527.1 family 43 glycosylhydrolase [Maribellus comscasis]